MLHSCFGVGVRSARFSVLALSVFCARSALAGPECPPGWYCEAPPAEESPSSEATAGDSAVQPDDIQAGDSVPPRDAESLPPTTAPAAPGHVSFHVEPVPPPRPKPWKQLGAQLRVSMALIGRASSEQGSAAGLGASFRYRPSRIITLELGLDVFSGRDSFGERRLERSLSASTLISPRSRRSVRPYLLTGLFLANATVGTSGAQKEYGYLGAQLGLGLEYALSHSVALSGDLIGFVRGRTDVKRADDNEFVDPHTGRATNTSGGGLLRAAAAYYF